MSMNMRFWSARARRHVGIGAENVGIRIENVGMSTADFVGVEPGDVGLPAPPNADVLRPPVPAPEGTRERDIFYIGGTGGRRVTGRIDRRAAPIALDSATWMSIFVPCIT
jgi:hypothetical protein